MWSISGINCSDSTQENWIFTELLPKQLQWFSEKEKTTIGGGKAGGWVAEQQEADEVPARSSPGGETPCDQSNSTILEILGPPGQDF